MTAAIQPSFWEKITPFQVTEGSAPSNRTDVLIVGAGLCGSWLAYFLKKRNPRLDIAVVEKSLGLGASTKNAGFLSPGNISEWLDDLQGNSWETIFETFLARLEGLHTVRREFGDRLFMDELGSADLDPVTPETADLMKRFNKELAARGLPPSFNETEMRLAGKNVPVITSPEGWGINPVELLNALHASLREGGVHLVFGARAENVGNGRAALVSQGHNHEIRYDYAFLCTNARAKILNPHSNVQPTRAQAVVTKPCDISNMPRALGFRYQGYDYFRPVGNRLLYGGGRHLFKEREAVESLEPTREIRDYLMGQIRNLLGHNDFEIDTHWAGVEGLRGGQHVTAAQLLAPVMLDSKTEEIAGFSTWGVTLSPFVAHRKAAAFGGSQKNSG
jgi:gamma-glutamylputrescine oxidase